MTEFLARLSALPPYGLGALLVLLLYAVQSEIRFGAKARSLSRSASDRGSTLAVSLAAVVPVLGFVLAMKAGTNPWIPEWFRKASLPWMPVIAWAGVLLGAIGLLMRLWAVLTLP